MWSKVFHLRFRILLSGVALGGATLIGALSWSEPGAQAATPTAAASSKMEAPRDDELIQRAHDIARSFLDSPFRLHFGDHEIVASRATLGARVDLDHLLILLKDSSNSASAMRRLHDHLHPGQPLQVPMPVEIDDSAALPAIRRLKDLVDQPATSARIDPRKRTVIPAQPGHELDIVATLVDMELAMRRERDGIRANVHTLAPKRTKDAFANVRMNAELASFETPYNRSNAADDRTHNLRVTARKIDGAVIPPGGIFDFNAVVGDRTRANGYRSATVISGGELADGMGGGTCQVASTLHAAVLFAGLPILTRTPHSRPSYYIKLGLDAAVAYGSLNFRFKNDRDEPIVIDATVDHGIMRVALWGASQDRTVTFIREITKAIPFNEQVVVDETLPVGLRVLKQRGVPGFEVKRERIIKNEANGEERRNVTGDIYPATTQIWAEGKGPEAEPDFVPPPDDSHPEYVADEFFTATRMAGSAAIDVKAEPGRFGSYGWTEREGLIPTASSTN